MYGFQLGFNRSICLTQLLDFDFDLSRSLKDKFIVQLTLHVLFDPILIHPHATSGSES